MARTNPVNLRLDDDEMAALRAAAERDGKPASTWIRETAVKQALYVEPDPAGTFTLGDSAYEQLSALAETDGVSKQLCLELAIHRSARIRAEYHQLQQERHQARQAIERLQEWSQKQRRPWWKPWAKQPPLPDLPALDHQSLPRQQLEPAAVGHVVDAPAQPVPATS